MKATKKLKLFSATAMILFVLCSAGYKLSRTETIEQQISFVGSNENLPDKPNTAFKEGEVLTYRLHYGALNAGVAVLEVKPQLLDVSGRKVMHIVANGYTNGAADWFFKVRDRYETYMDRDAMVPWLFVRRVDEGGFKFSQDYVFNHYTKKVDIGNGEKFDVPSGIQDMVSAFYTARSLDLSNAKPGDLFSLNRFVDKEIWPVKIKFIGRETIKTDIGKFKCLRFRPVVQKGRIFKSEDDLNVWISDDKNHIPMRVQANIIIGSIKMDITSAKNLSNQTGEVD
ncbi:MAG: DUF3108 domain-containing protein [Sphingobacteriaceae bacterium]|nr:DUF3108 domain-containing protein [Sphingobacteriaceae bacterium]